MLAMPQSYEACYANGMITWLGEPHPKGQESPKRPHCGEGADAR